MATAESLRYELEGYLTSKGLKFQNIDDDDNIIALFFSGDRNDTYILIDFIEDGNNASGVHFSSMNFAKCSGPVSEALPVINGLNRDYKWVKFWVSDEGMISGDMDAFVYPGSVGEECAQIVLIMSQVIEHAMDVLRPVAYIDGTERNMLAMFSMLRG